MVTFYTNERTERYLTNLDLPPEEIREIYRMRWSIEIFFREIKSYLKIERFIGRNLNVVANLLHLNRLRPDRIAQSVLQDGHLRDKEEIEIWRRSLPRIHPDCLFIL